MKNSNKLLSAVFALAIFLSSSVAFGQVKVNMDGDCIIGNSTDPDAANLKTQGTSELEFALDALAGNADFTMQLNGVSKAQFKYNGGLQGIQINVDDASSSNFAIPNTKNAIFISGVNQSVGIGTQTTGSSKLFVNGNLTYNGSLTNASDRRLKQNVQNFQYGLNEVLQLRPKTYEYNGKADIPTGMSHVGLVAQDLQKVAPELVGSFEHVSYKEQSIKSQEQELPLEIEKTEKFLNIKESSIKYMLVNAIQDQQEIIETQNDMISELSEQLEALEGRINNYISNPTVTQTNVTLSESAVAELGVNRPNPFETMTSIPYTIPADAQNATMKFFNISGQLIKTVAIDHTGAGNLTVNAADMAAGTFTYTLTVDGQLVATKKMVLTK